VREKEREREREREKEREKKREREREETTQPESVRIYACRRRVFVVCAKGASCVNVEASSEVTVETTRTFVSSHAMYDVWRHCDEWKRLGKVDGPHTFFIYERERQ
jgi:hypothetical protein